MQGVSIMYLYKRKTKEQKNQPKEFSHYDLWKRDFKYEFLDSNSLKSIDWQKLEYSETKTVFCKKDFNIKRSIKKGFKVDDYFYKEVSGVKQLEIRLRYIIIKKN